MVKNHWILGIKNQFKCDICGKEFSQAGHLRQHISAVHEGQRDHCDVCGKPISKGYLEKHIKTVHEGQKDWKCESCGKVFSLLIHLQRHIKTVHEGQRDFKCNYCDKTYTAKKNLNSHIKNVHERMSQEIPSWMRKDFWIYYIKYLI